MAKRGFKAGEVLFRDIPLNLIHFNGYLCHFPALEVVCKQVKRYLQKERQKFDLDLEPFAFLPALQVADIALELDLISFYRLVRS